MLCLRDPIFSHPKDEGTTELRRRAFALKQEVALHEAEIDAQMQAGKVCLISIARLAALKDEQYRLAQKL